MSEKIVGRKTLHDGTCVPLTEPEANAIWSKAIENRKKRAEDMPTEQDAINAMHGAYLRLRELGWRDAIYCPKDMSPFQVIEPGSSGIHDCSYWGEWPNGAWNIHSNGDLWPSRPCLFKLKEEDK